ncbi:MAG: Crp/Fnr family transcriptional regulator [Bacteroidetes bacterium]|nr:Crp/Fnr family transcriptional regulator [Bacteroidota bacterium]
MLKETPILNCKNCQARLDSIFCTLEDKEIEILQEIKGCSSYKKGQMIFSQGTVPHGLYVVYSGKVKLHQLAENGREQIVRLAKPGDIIGYRSLLSADRYTSTAEAIEESTICFIPKKVFWHFMNSNQTIPVQLMKLLSNDLKKAEHTITNIAQKPVKERLAEAILFVKETYGYEPESTTISVTLTREEIANIIGTATETTIRLLSDLKKEKIIDFVGKRIKIINHTKLVALANIDD